MSTSVVDLAQALIRFPTVNPPGAERDCILWAEGLLRAAGAETIVTGPSPERPSLVARVAGTGQAPPLVLQGHVDVVGVADQAWRHDPFAGEIIDGELWGRGAIDMKGQVAVMLAAVLDLLASGQPPAGDVLLVLLADEEQGGDLGARWLVEHRPELFDGVRHAIGEWGGTSWWVGDRAVYPVQVDEKRFCTLTATFEGPAGHAAMPMPGRAVGRAGRFLAAVDQLALPVRVGPIAGAALAGVRELVADDALPAFDALAAGRSDDLTALASLGDLGMVLSAGLRNTVAPTVVRAGEKFNMIPARAEVTLDCRLLPGARPEEVVEVLCGLPGEPVVEVAYHDDVAAPGDHSLLPLLGDLLRAEDPGAIVIPYILFAGTDGRHFARLGIQPYGFTPLRLPPGFAVLSLAHAADERVPVDALAFGVRVTTELLRRYRG